MEIRKVGNETYEVWTRFESDRVRVTKRDGRWIMVGSYVGGSYSPSSLGSPLTPKKQREMDAAVAQGV